MAASLTTPGGGTGFGGLGGNKRGRDDDERDNKQQPQQPLQQQQQPPSQWQARSGVQRDESATIVPINMLNPYSNKWAIRARLMEKDMRTYCNAKGDGRFFNLTVVDASGEIRITGFNETYDAIYDKIQLGGVYLISGGTLKPKNAQWNTTSHEFEITLNHGCQFDMTEEPGGPEAIPLHNFNFIPIDQLEIMPEDTLVDVCAIVVSATEPNSFTAKSGKEMTRRVLVLADRSQAQIECSCFGEPTMALIDGTVVAIRKAKVGAWNTKSLTIWGDGQITVHPDMPKAHELMGWWRSQGANASLRSLSTSAGGGRKAARRIVFSNIDEQALGLNDSDTFSTRCLVTHIKSNQRQLWYIACPWCKKKLGAAEEYSDLTAQCEKCDKTVQGVRRWILTATCNDSTGSRYVSFFDDAAAILLGGKTADEMAQIKEANPSAFEQHFNSASFKPYIMRGHVKNDVYNGKARLKVSCTSLTPLDWLQEGRALLKQIDLLRAKGDIEFSP